VSISFAHIIGLLISVNGGEFKKLESDSQLLKMHPSPWNYLESLGFSRYCDCCINKIFKYFKKLPAFMYMQYVTQYVKLPHLNIVR